MKTKFSFLGRLSVLLVALSCFSALRIHAQNFITIQDSLLVATLSSNVPNAFVGNQMQTDHPDVINRYNIYISSMTPGLVIGDLSPLSYFTNLEWLHIESVILTEPPPVLPRLKALELLGTNLTYLNPFPDSLELIYIVDNDLGTLPPIPGTVQFALFPYNNLTVCPDLSHVNTLISLDLRGNLITEFPIVQYNEGFTFPQLYLDNNLISCIPDNLHPNIGFTISGNPIYCVPHYASSSTCCLNLPLCYPNDPINNPSDCPLSGGVYGKIFVDANMDCIPQQGELLTEMHSVSLKDAAGNLVGMSAMGPSGNYFLPAQPGNYTVQFTLSSPALDTACNNPTVIPVQLTAADPVMMDVNLALECPAHPDFFLSPVVPVGLVFPGQPHFITLGADELFNSSQLGCFLSTPVQMTLSIAGPVTVVSAEIISASGTVQINGNDLVFVFDSLVPYARVKIELLTDTTAQIGDQVCVETVLSDLSGSEVELANNFQIECYDVFNSYDPNIKLADRDTVPPLFSDEITYTIYFQNTGNAPAINIRIEDPLDYNLDLETLYITSASHPFTFNLLDNRLMMFFHNIFLPDSISDPTGSIGFFQFRVKPVPGLEAGTVIQNYAGIYFDFNSPIFTNIAETVFYQPVFGMEETTWPSGFISVYPNPTTGILSFSGDVSLVEVVDVVGKIRLNLPTSAGSDHIDVSSLEPGLYFARLYNSGRLIGFSKFVKQ